MNLSLDDLILFREPQQEAEHPKYVAVKCMIPAVNENGDIVFGLTLQQINEDKCLDALKEEIDAVGDCEHIILPDEIIEGKVYTIRYINKTVDWETGYLDGYDIEIIEDKP